MVKEVSAMEQGVAVTVLHATSSGKDIKKASSSDAPSKPISKTAQLDDAFSTPSTATPAHAPHAPLKASYAARVFGRHLMNALACMVPYVLAAMLPIQIVYDKGSKEGAFTLWIFESFFLSNFSFVYSNVFWHRSLLGLPFTFRHDFKAIQLPCLVCAVVTCGVYILVGRAFTWPLNNPASAVWGGTQYTTVPPLTTWFLLPKEMKAEPGFLKRFLWNAYVPANAFVFFFMTAVYYLVFSFSGSYKFGVLVLFKLAATVFGGITVRIVHKVVAMNGHGDALRTAAAMKFFIEVSYEIYVFFTIHDLHGWPLFSAYLLMEMAILTFECWHDEESALDAWLKYPSMWLQRLKNANSPPAEPTPLPPKAKDHHVSHHSANHEGEHHAHNLVDMDAVAASNAMLHVEGRKHFNARVLHYCVAVQARIYGAIATTVLLPTWYYGPNRDWYIFEFSSLDLWNSLGLVWLSVGVTLVHVLLTRHFVWKAFKIDLVVAWVGYADTFSDYFWAAYTTAPVFPAVQLGRQWGMVWFFRRISGLGVPNIP